MGIANIGIPGLLLIIVIALIVFGPKKMPEIGKAAGDTLKAFKSSVNDRPEEEGNKEKEREENSKQ